MFCIRYWQGLCPCNTNDCPYAHVDLGDNWQQVALAHNEKMSNKAQEKGGESGAESDASVGDERRGKHGKSKGKRKGGGRGPTADAHC